MPANKLYWFQISSPSQAVRKMLELKGIEYDSVNVLPGNQRIHMRLAGFPGKTVPGLVLDGRKIQTSRAIARALEEAVPEPALFPADPAERARVEEAERWGDEELQMVLRRPFLYGSARNNSLRRWVADHSPLPAPGVGARLGALSGRHLARVRGATEEAVRADLAGLPAALDHADSLVADGTINPQAPNAAAFQVLSVVRLMDCLSDLHGYVAPRPCGSAAREVFPEDFARPAPNFLPPDWLP